VDPNTSDDTVFLNDIYGEMFYIVINDSNFDPAAVLDGWSSTTTNAGLNDLHDDDGATLTDPNITGGTPFEGLKITTATQAGHNNYTYDF
jgi:hypothetical protein